ncbi:multicopper oxidase family protein [Micromonospora sp. NPDC006431]|uniref:multicopper oxidase family protein n=1 Tax=Micromonospora sp. NPDC006431 TaxID=3364235 RepID=UPI003696EE47
MSIHPVSSPPAPRWRRRGFLAVLLAIPAGAAGVTSGVLGLLWANAVIDTAGRTDFVRPLAIPPLATSRVENGRRVFDLRAIEGTRDFGLGDRQTATWGFNGSYLGPTLRAKRGEQIQINVSNELGEKTTVHWHGHHLPAAMDGNPHQLVEPGETWSPAWQIDQPAATTWYHPHLHGSTAAHVYRGLAGMFILDDADSATLGLPFTYGVDDIPLIVQDKSFDTDGQLHDGDPTFSPVGFLGDTIVTNGTTNAYHDVTTELVRLRILNGSNARLYDFGMHDDRGFSLIGTDGGLLPAPYRTNRVRLSPGERAEIVVRLRAGEDAVLRSYPPDLGTDFWNERFAGGDDTFDILQLRAADSLASSPALPERLADPPDLDAADAKKTRTFRLGGSNINGKKMDMSRIDEAVEVDTAEIWEVTNPGNTPHNFHVHDVQFTVLDIDGRRPAPELSGWKDTIYVEPGTTARLILRFSDYTDPDIPYMFHCHVLRHEDRGMMGQFLVLRKGQGPGRPPAAEHDHQGSGGGLLPDRPPAGAGIRVRR